MEAEFDRIRDDLRRLQNAVQGGRFPINVFPDIFGAGFHKFRTHPGLSEETILRFEAQHRVRLPSEYRGFLIHVGNGGAGPPYGLSRLGEYEGEPWIEGGGFVGILPEPFPHCAPWNDLSGLPPWDKSWPDDPNWDEAGYERQMEAWQTRYWDTAHVNGAFPICNLGCNHRLWLVVTGIEAGNIWNDCRADQAGLYPLQQSGRERVSFLVWYRAWLATALERLS